MPLLVHTRYTPARLHARRLRCVASPLFSCIDSAVHRTHLPLPALFRRRMHSRHIGRARCALCMHSAVSVALHAVIHSNARTHTRLYSFSVTFGTG
ncbi:hypothetical protein B0H14DRAFT_3453059 [Mycena olivaceomarginata]|nr:hypothetical protein B0H14DRAFT_3453059 [Mycena olivaceomarginata]